MITATTASINPYAAAIATAIQTFFIYSSGTEAASAATRRLL